MDGLIEGRVVHYVMPNGKHRPAMVSRVWESERGMVNLVVTLDGRNDIGDLKAAGVHPDDIQGFQLWATSEYYSEQPEPHTWHWIEKA